SLTAASTRAPHRPQNAAPAAWGAPQREQSMGGPRRRGLMSACFMPAPPLRRPVHADLLFLDGPVLTQDPAHPESDALAVVGNRIAALGDAARAMRGEAT